MDPSPFPREGTNPKPFVLLPEDTVEEILSRLPAKSLLRFRCVSKSRRSLIDSKHFKKNHLQNITKNKTDIHRHRRVIFNCNQHGLNQRSSQSYTDDPSLDPSPFDDPKNAHLMTAGVHVVGHCNGVLCIRKDPCCFFLWNPTTRISTELPKLELGVTTKSGFGWDEGTDTYKVFAVVSDKGRSIGKLYSTKTDSWKTVDHGCLSVCGEYGVLACGNLHWVKKSGFDIEAFDLNSEVFGVIHHPIKPKVGDSLLLFESGRKGSRGCLGMMCHSTDYDEKTMWRHWVMKQYGVKESWVKLTSSTRKLHTCCKAMSYYIESLVSPKS